MRKKTTAEFVADAIAVHGKKYSYDRSVYTTSRGEVEIRCNHCDLYFWQAADSHLAGRGCSHCRYERSSGKRRHTVEKFIAKAQGVHPGLYDYGRVIYVNSSTPVEIFCLKCHVSFWQAPNNHTSNKQGCPICGLAKVAAALSDSPEDFIKKASDKHPGKYDYSRSIYVNSTTPVEILCLSCNRAFFQTPSDHIGSGAGCPKCGIDRRAKKRTLKLEQFIENATNKHGCKFNYVRAIYNGALSPIEIGCNTCGQFFWQTPNAHVSSGQGCPLCKESHGERLVASVLDSLGVRYHRQHKFDGCKHKRRLPFDFYLPDHNVAVEFHGRQHYEHNEFFGSEKDFKAAQKRDRIKQRHCDRNNIHLEVIPYWYNEQQVKAIVSRLAHVQLTLI